MGITFTPHPVNPYSHLKAQFKCLMGDTEISWESLAE